MHGDRFELSNPKGSGFTVRRVWPLRYPCLLMTPSLRARAPPIYYERRTPRKRSCSTLLRRRARFKDGVRFELTNDFRRFWFSRPTPSATRPTIHSRWVLCVHLTHLKSSFFTDAKSNVHGVRNCESEIRTHGIRLMRPTI